MSQTPPSEAPQGTHRVTKTELVWPGKYDEQGNLWEVPRVSLPFQVIETISESRATREAKHERTLSLFDVYEGTEGDTFEDGWRNKLIWGENLLVMGSLLGRFAGQVDLIYIDPPFATGADFSFETQIGDDDDATVTKQQSSIEEKAYRDTWGGGRSSYLQMLGQRLSLARDLLSAHGTLYVHCDFRVSSYVRIMLDELFGSGAFVNEVIWHYGLGNARAQRYFHRKHDTLLVYGRSESYIFNVLRGDVTPAMEAKYCHEDEDGRYMMSYGRKYYLKGGKPLDTVWEVPSLAATDSERLAYATQKPESLLTRIIQASSNEGSLVADFFCGSGTTMAVAEKLGRRWLGCDLSRWAVHVARKRLLGIEGCRPFEVLNLGKYERKYWQSVTFSDRHGTDQQLTLYEYLAFILRLYGAEPLAGMQYIHGKKGKVLVHVGAVDAPVTIGEISDCIEESLAIGQAEVHILAWEWEMGLTNPMVQEAKRRGVKLLLLNIPREVMEQQAVERGDVRFFEVAHLEVEIATGTKREATAKLVEFSFPYADLIPEDVRSKIRKWSDYIDYWAVDWDFQNDTFMNGWVTYRTRKDRTLPLQSDTHAYEAPGTYRVMVKVVDIFGNDTSQVFEVEVK